MGLGCENKENKFLPNSQHFDFFLPWTISHLPPTIPSSLMQIGPGISEIMINYPRKAALLGYRSLAHYRSLGFDN